MANKYLVKQNDELVQKIDSDIKNKWKWSWLEKAPFIFPLEMFIKKIHVPGEAHCTLCNARIKYGGKGVSSIIKHCNTASHMKIEKIEERNASRSWSVMTNE